MAIVEWVKGVWETSVRFLREVRREVRHIVWPGKQEVIGSTVVVILSVGIVSVFLGLVDLVLRVLLGYVVR